MRSRLLFGLDYETKRDIKNISSNKTNRKKIALTADMVEIMVKAEIDGTEFRAIAKELRISVGRRMWCYMHSHQ